MKNSTEEKERVRQLLKRPFEILNERPSDMSQSEYNELRKIQKKSLKLTSKGKFVVEVAANRTKLLKSIGQYPSRHSSAYCKAYTSRKGMKYQKRFLVDLAGNLSEIPKQTDENRTTIPANLREMSNFAIKQITGKDVVTKTFINN